GDHRLRRLAADEAAHPRHRRRPRPHGSDDPGRAVMGGADIPAATPAGRAQRKAAKPPAAPPVAATKPRRRGAGFLRPLAFLAGPAAVLGLLFLGPMFVMLVISIKCAILSGSSAIAFSNYSNVFPAPIDREVAWTMVQIATM